MESALRYRSSRDKDEQASRLLPIYRPAGPQTINARVSNGGSVEFVGTRILIDDFLLDDCGEIIDHGFALGEFSTRRA
jgi:hypothetical protein